MKAIQHIKDDFDKELDILKKYQIEILGIKILINKTKFQYKASIEWIKLKARQIHQHIHTEINKEVHAYHTTSGTTSPELGVMGIEEDLKGKGTETFSVH